MKLSKHDRKQIKKLLEWKKDFEELQKLPIEERAKIFRKRMRGEK